VSPRGGGRPGAVRAGVSVGGCAPAPGRAGLSGRKRAGGGASDVELGHSTSVGAETPPLEKEPCSTRSSYGFRSMHCPTMKGFAARRGASAAVRRSDTARAARSAAQARRAPAPALLQTLSRAAEAHIPGRAAVVLRAAAAEPAVEKVIKDESYDTGISIKLVKGDGFYEVTLTASTPRPGTGAPPSHDAARGASRIGGRPSTFPPTGALPRPPEEATFRAHRAVRGTCAGSRC